MPNKKEGAEIYERGLLDLTVPAKKRWRFSIGASQ
jgi:hypothetical protein